MTLPDRKTISRFPFFVFIFLFFVLSQGFYWTTLGGEFNDTGKGLAFSFAPVIPVFMGLFALREQCLRNSRGWTLFFLTLGVLSFMIGEGLWTYYDLVLQVDPFPSLADLFYSLAYPFFFIGLVNELRNNKLEFKSVSKLLLSSLLLNSLLIAGVIAYVGIYMAYTPGVGFWENFFALGYGAGDLVLIIMNFFVFFLAWKERKEGVTSAWFYFFCAILLSLFADVLFALFELEHSQKVWPYFQGIDSIWILSYLYFAASFFEFRLSCLQKKKGRSKLLA